MPTTFYEFPSHCWCLLVCVYIYIICTNELFDFDLVACHTNFSGAQFVMAMFVIVFAHCDLHIAMISTFLSFHYSLSFIPYSIIFGFQWQRSSSIFFIIIISLLCLDPSLIVCDPLSLIPCGIIQSMTSVWLTHTYSFLLLLLLCCVVN